MTNELFDIEVAREYLSYDPETGHFIWLKRASNRIKVGDKAGCLSVQGYVVIRLFGTLVRASRLACAFQGLDLEGKHVDHVNGDTTDNRLENLRVCTRHENMHNLKPHTDNAYSKWKGVSWNTNNKKWYSRIYVNGKSKFLGYFDDEREAAEEYLFAALKLHGDFARFA